MQIYEKEIEHENGEKYLLITFNHHRAEIFRTKIPLKHERCAALRIAKAKEAAIDEFLTTFNGKKYTKKEVLKAYAKQDEYFKGVYKELYPQGGKRDGGGRPKGIKTDKTESLGTRISAKEKELLNLVLTEYRCKTNIIKTGIRTAENEIHLECRFTNGQKFTGIILDKELSNAESLARIINILLNNEE